MKLEPEHTWWHEHGCHALVVADERPTECKCGDPSRFVDFGWRVGQHSSNHSYYSTYERALTDRRLK